MTQSTTTAAAPTAPRNGFGITALVLALVGLVFGLVSFTGFIALALGLLAVLFGLLGWSRTRDRVATNRTVAMIATVLGIGAAALGIWSIVSVFNAVERLGKDLQDVDRTPAAIDDLAVPHCFFVTSEDGVSSARATVEITNKTDRAQSYMATIEVNNASGARIGEINTVRHSLAAGQSVITSGMDTSGNPIIGVLPGPAPCFVANVNRFPS